MWILFSLLAAFTSAIVVTLSKAAIKNVDSNLVFAIQAIIILLVSWGVVTWQGNISDVGQIERRTWVFLGLAGLLTCISSLLAFYALKMGDASRVSPLERLSLVFAIVFAVIFLKEKVDWPVILGAGLMAIGAIIIAVSGYSSK
ncbi:EamA family transporter [Adhaeribacter radiodurans]|uniref:EamA family transporter n=1 Tax=Adhaeribacter radiodurans TaxID=2745197 RepID=A0A7L7L4T3_9BACT|nr:EamA family transporter [Adhaeribacter radiodurans]QMU27812.1 EamA family transporter [Adhaeribacter radiodurans]